MHAFLRERLNRLRHSSPPSCRRAEGEYGGLRCRAPAPAADRYVPPVPPPRVHPTISRVCCLDCLHCPPHRTELSRNPPDGISVGLADDDNIYKWEVMIMGPQETMYEGGFFKARLDFPPDFPNENGTKSNGFS